MEASVEAQRFARAEGLVLSTLGGVQNAMPRMAQTTPFRTADNYRDFIKRISATPKFAHETIERLRAGMKSGWLSPVPVLDRVVAAIDAHVADTVEDSTLLTPFRNFASGVPEDERAALTAAARRAIAEDYQPALRRFKAFIVNEYGPRRRKWRGSRRCRRCRVLRVPHSYAGGPWMKPAEVHQLGLRQVERLRREIGEVALQTGFKGTTDAFIESLRTDKKYFFDSSDSLLAAYREVGKRIDPQLPKLFHATPRMPYAVRAMTPSESASSTAANYMPGSLPLGTSGYFTINALGYKNEATWRTETLFVHEAIPGHHMQVARAAEMEKLHPWRSMGSRNVAYSEGWRSTRRSSASISPLQGSLPALRAPASRALSRRAARRRYRHPCVRLAARQGHRVHGRAGWPGPGFRCERSRSLLLQSFAGPRYMLGQRKFSSCAPVRRGLSVRNSMCAISMPS